jgi:hypothetical protein
VKADEWASYSNLLGGTNLTRDKVLADKGRRDKIADWARNLEDSPHAYITKTINAAVNSCRIVQWAARDGKLYPGILCPDLGTALYALLLVRSSRPPELRLCAAPDCRKFFRRKGKKLWCSPACSARIGMKAFRGKKKSGKQTRSRKKGLRHGSRKKK